MEMLEMDLPIKKEVIAMTITSSLYISGTLFTMLLNQFIHIRIAKFFCFGKTCTSLFSCFN